jgi:chemotaxis protein methyltransferase CheR
MEKDNSKIDMDFSTQNKIFQAQLSEYDFSRLSKFITKEFGIKLPPVKKVMLQSRIQKRLRTLGITSYKDYVDYVFSHEGTKSELIHMIDVVTTNKTDFFREANHFAFLKEYVLPHFADSLNYKGTLKVWSAGCSSGEEPYTLAMVISEFVEQRPAFDFQILGTDLSSRILESAELAIYPEKRVEIVPMMMKKKYLLKSKDKDKSNVRIAPELRRKVIFKRLNFMDATYDIKEMFDIVFCRNVLIYFDRDVQESVINKLCTRLKPGGYFFLGHSESIMNMKIPLKQVKPTIFIRV